MTPTEIPLEGPDTDDHVADEQVIAALAAVVRALSRVQADHADTGGARHLVFDAAKLVEQVTRLRTLREFRDQN